MPAEVVLAVLYELLTELIGFHRWSLYSTSVLKQFSDLFCCAADIISAVEFDQTGQHLATGDRGGRVVLFERLSAPPVRTPAAAELSMRLALLQTSTQSPAPQA